MESWQIMNLLEMVIIAGSVLGGLGMITYAWVKRRPQLGKGELSGLTESINTLRESVDGMREELGDVSDRLDFTERVLTRIADTAKTRDQRLPK
ncbi:MAG: hypothetical protein AMS18_10870 [Gemmatimonas sp. SG8_17]|nr:MAG: hypothetical protein AMS18_10870 [Gemmatimonas sp. SG8_17]